MEAEERQDAPRAPEPSGPAPPRRTDRPLEPESHERCAHHPGRASVARCDGCGEPVCLSCAIPVRGRILGPGCVADELGDPALVVPPEVERPRSWIALAGAVVAVLGTAAPWTRTGAGDRVFGAWVLTARWSLVAATASVALLIVAWRLADRRVGRVAVLTLGTGVVVASVLSILFPPTFQAASWGPWVTAVGGGVATAGIWLGAGRAVGPAMGV